MNHTPGPWRAYHTKNHGVVIMARPAPHANEHSVAKVYVLAEDTQAANAWLIAAAPDLYDAVIAMAERVPLVDSPNHKHTCGECHVCHEIAEQALAKAEGGEP